MALLGAGAFPGAGMPADQIQNNTCRPARRRLPALADQSGLRTKMKTQSVEDHILSLLSDTFPERPCRAITRDVDLSRDLGADSMTMVSLIFSIDEKFHVGTDQLGDLIVSCRTVGDLVDATQRLQREQIQLTPAGGRMASGSRT